MSRTKYLREHIVLVIWACVYISCFEPMTCYAGIELEDNGDLEISRELSQIEDSLNLNLNDDKGENLESSIEKNIAVNDHVIPGLQESISSDEKRARFSAWAGKRGSFNSWGGKRNSPSLTPWDEKSKRAGFNAWGGKRGHTSNQQNVKRPKFSSWGGKRADTQIKRPSFSSWGGKRSVQEQAALDTANDKRAKFMAWGGKRSDVEQYLHSNDLSDFDQKRGKFAAWGGKRSPEDSENMYKRPQFSSWGGKRFGPNPNENLLDKRPQFSSWGGKRSQAAEAEDNTRANYNSWEKRKFNSWGGKRSYRSTQLVDIEDPKRSDSAPAFLDTTSDHNKETTHLIAKRSIEYPQIPEWKRRFNPWAGKRGVLLASEVWPEQTKRNFSPWGGKRASFNPWAGKRNDESADDDKKEVLWYLKRRAFAPWGGK